MSDSTGDRTTIPILDDVIMRAASRQILADATALAKSIETLPLGEASVETVLDVWDRMNMIVEDILGPASILGSVHPDRKVRDAADDVLLEATRFTTELFQNEELFKRIEQLSDLTGADAQFRKDLIEAFEDSGVALPAERRQRVREIVEEIERLNQSFDRNVRDNNTTLTFTAEETRGLPQSFLDKIKRHDDGNIILSFDYPEYGPFMAHAESEPARRRYYVAYTNRGSAENLQILDQIVALRKELAALYDLPSYAAYVTRRNMSGNPDSVRKFLDDVAGIVAQAERSELDELKSIKAEHTRAGADQTTIERWDVNFYSEKLRQSRFSVDQEQVRRHFPTIPTLNWSLGATEQLYGVRFVSAAVPLWHSDVLYYDVLDAESNAFIGGIYLDLFPREGKYKHAAAWPVRGVSTKAGRKPISVLVCNFDRVGLSHPEVETLLHEFGHVLHGVLSTTEYNAHSGTSVERDFVEAPSQMYEEWARRSESLALMRQHSPDSPPIDDELIARLASSRRFGRGINYARQHLYATFDMSLASEQPGRSMDVWKEMERATPMGYVEETAFPGTFGHIAADYAAGYYGYMWSEVLALDMLSMFGDNIMNVETGRRFRHTILSNGGSVPARDMVREFLGRDVSSDAFYAEIAGKR